MLGSFFGLVAHFFDFLTHLKLSCVFVMFFFCFWSDFSRFGEGLGRDFGRFFHGSLVILSKFFEN